MQQQFIIPATPACRQVNKDGLRCAALLYDINTDEQIQPTSVYLLSETFTSPLHGGVNGGRLYAKVKWGGLVNSEREDEVLLSRFFHWK